MSYNKLFATFALTFGICLSASFPRLASAVELVSDPVGYYKLALLGNSDNYVSIPFSRPVFYPGQVASVSGNVVTLQGTPGWTAGQLVYVSGSQSNTYYVRFDSGTLEGRWYTITNNGTGSVSLDLHGDTLTGLATDDLISIIPHWTLGTVFAGGNGIHTSPVIGNKNTQILIADTTSDGINNAAGAAGTYYLLDNGTWNKNGGGSISRNDDILSPNVYMVIRHNIASNTVYISSGSVVLSKIAIPLRANVAVPQDNPRALMRPIAVSLNDSGLTNGGAFVQSSLGLPTKDTLLTFDNSSATKNKSPSATYFFDSTSLQWRKSGGGTVNYGTSNVFQPGTGFIIRKVTNSSAPTWVNTATYTNN